MRERESLFNQERITPQISITVNEPVLKEIDRFSKKFGISRSKLINNILAMGMADAKLLEKVGLIDLANIVRNFQIHMKKELRIA